MSFHSESESSSENNANPKLQEERIQAEGAPSAPGAQMLVPLENHRVARLTAKDERVYPAPFSRSGHPDYQWRRGDYLRENADGWTPVSISGHCFGAATVSNGGPEPDPIEWMEVSLCLLHSVADGARLPDDHSPVLQHLQVVRPT